MSDTALRLLTEADLTAYRELLLPGLEQDADSFRIAPDDEQNAPFPTHNRPDSFTLGTFVDGQLAGVVSFQREGADRIKLRHKGLLFRMYVSPMFWGKGLARLLIQEVIDRARQLDGIEQINLTVITTNPAKRLYERFGFQSFSLEKRAIKLDFSLMRPMLRRSAITDIAVDSFLRVSPLSQMCKKSFPAINSVLWGGRVLADSLLLVLRDLFRLKLSRTAIL